MSFWKIDTNYWGKGDFAWKSEEARKPSASIALNAKHDKLFLSSTIKHHSLRGGCLFLEVSAATEYSAFTAYHVKHEVVNLQQYTIPSSAFCGNRKPSTHCAQSRGAPGMASAEEMTGRCGRGWGAILLWWLRG
jgi:hypothetical protein